LSLVYRLMMCLLGLLAVLFRSDLSKDAELLVLRHENLWGSITRFRLGACLVGDHRRVIFSVVYMLARCLLGCLMARVRREVSQRCRTAGAAT
jgi:hypothetical protein